MARIGYSTLDQAFDIQHAKLKAEGCADIRSEKVSVDSREGRTELATVLEFLRPGDELVTRLDRQNARRAQPRSRSRATAGLRHCARPARVDAGRDESHCADGATVLGMVAQMERRFINERQRDGIERARGEGVYRGGKRRLARDHIRACTQSGICIGHRQKLGCSRIQVYRVFISST